MNATILTEKSHFLCSGPGLDNVELEDAQFEVRHAGGTKRFDKLLPAVVFYCALQKEASLWEVTGPPKLLELKIPIVPTVSL